MQDQYQQRRKLLAKQVELRSQFYELTQQRQELIDQLYDLLEDLGANNNRRKKAEYFPFNILARLIYRGLTELENMVSKIVAAIFRKR